MDSVNFDGILEALNPLAGDTITVILNILLYLVFILSLIAFFMQDEKQIEATILVGLTMAAAVIGKLSTATANNIDMLEPTHLTMLIVNAGIFVIPLIVTGMSKAKKSKPLTIIAGVIGGFYFFMYWFFLQSGM